MKHAKIYTIDLRTKIPYETVEFKEFFLKKFFNPNPRIEPPNPKNTNQNPKKTTPFKSCIHKNTDNTPNLDPLYQLGFVRFFNFYFWIREYQYPAYFVHV